MALETHQNTQEVHMCVHKAQRVPMYLERFMREFPHTWILWLRASSSSSSSSSSFSLDALSPYWDQMKCQFFHHAPPWALEVCTDIEWLPFSSRASQGQIVALRMWRLEDAIVIGIGTRGAERTVAPPPPPPPPPIFCHEWCLWLQV